MTSRFLYLFVLCLLSLVTKSCGYHFGQGSLPSQYSTFNVPYVIGDEDGALTCDIIKQLNVYSGLQYVQNGAELLIQVELVDFRDDNIGFRYDRNKHGKLTESIIPTETRTTVWAEVTVVDSSTREALLGPAKLSCCVDFDHDYYSSRNGINIFSLGQLDDYDAAHDAVYYPLYKALAKKIADYVCDSW